jgi:hypothetical protein
MLVLGVLCVIIGAGGAGSGSDTSHTSGSPADRPVVDTVQLAPTDTSLLRFRLAPLDTPPPRRRPKAIEVSDWYSRRLTIHRYMAYSTIPLFGIESIAGEELLRKSAAAPTWAKTMHRAGATALVGTFTVNTVTGLWNWWDSRSVPQNRILRTAHAASMLVADAAFSYTGARLSEEAETSSVKRQQHYVVAISAMGLTVASGLAMKIWNR